MSAVQGFRVEGFEGLRFGGLRVLGVWGALRFGVLGSEGLRRLRLAGLRTYIDGRIRHVIQT